MSFKAEVDKVLPGDYKPGLQALEVHSAATTDVDTMVKKLEWLKNGLGTKAPELRRLTAENGYLWIASGGVHIRKGSPQDKRLRKEGLAFPREHLRIE